MTPVSIASLAATVVSLVLSGWLVLTNHSTQALQNELQTQQQELQSKEQLVQTQQQRLQGQQDAINTGNALAQQVGPQVLQAMGNMVVQNKNEKLRGLLKKYGVEVQEKPNTPAAAGGTPAPANP